jgi:hypothetical protein
MAQLKHLLRKGNRKTLDVLFDAAQKEKEKRDKARKKAQMNLMAAVVRGKYRESNSSLTQNQSEMNTTEKKGSPWSVNEVRKLAELCGEKTNVIQESIKRPASTINMKIRELKKGEYDELLSQEQINNVSKLNFNRGWSEEDIITMARQISKPVEPLAEILGRTVNACKAVRHKLFNGDYDELLAANDIDIESAKKNRKFRPVSEEDIVTVYNTWDKSMREVGKMIGRTEGSVGFIRVRINKGEHDAILAKHGITREATNETPESSENGMSGVHIHKGNVQPNDGPVIPEGEYKDSLGEDKGETNADRMKKADGFMLEQMGAELDEAKQVNIQLSEQVKMLSNANAELLAMNQAYEKTVADMNQKLSKASKSGGGKSFTFSVLWGAFEISW